MSQSLSNGRTTVGLYIYSFSVFYFISFPLSDQKGEVCRNFHQLFCISMRDVKHLTKTARKNSSLFQFASRSYVWWASLIWSIRYLSKLVDPTHGPSFLSGFPASQISISCFAVWSALCLTVHLMWWWKTHTARHQTLVVFVEAW